VGEGDRLGDVRIAVSMDQWLTAAGKRRVGVTGFARANLDVCGRFVVAIRVDACVVAAADRRVGAVPFW
jgi:hypothetical protein